MPVCRLLFRLDFDINYDIIEHPGELMRLVNGVRQGFWKEDIENTQNRGFGKRYVSEDSTHVREFTVEPKNIVALFESVYGVAHTEMAGCDDFLQMAKIADDICKKFKIDRIIRSGIRIFYFGSGDKQAMKDAFRTSIDKKLVAGIEDVLGSAEDYGINVDGCSQSGIKYHCRTGPILSDENYAKYFQRITPAILERAKNDFICDIDLYEQNVALAQIPMKKWFLPKLDKSVKLIDSVESFLSSRTSR